MVMRGKKCEGEGEGEGEGRAIEKKKTFYRSSDNYFISGEVIGFRLSRATYTQSSSQVAAHTSTSQTSKGC